MPSKKKKRKLPSALVPFPNTDKEWHEEWTPGRSLINFPHPFRGVLLGPPNSGKSTCVKNILIHADPPFEKMTVIHADPENSTEYEDSDAEVIGTIPAPSEWKDSDLKQLVVVDDLDVSRLGVTGASALDRLFGYVSTHKNISVILCSQDTFNVPASVRRCANLWVLWPMSDLTSVRQCAKKCGNVPLVELFQMCENPHDSIWIDLTDKSPEKVRKNGFEAINLKDVAGLETVPRRSNSTFSA